MAPITATKDGNGRILSVSCNIVPQPKQEAFFSAKAPIVAYGGARGGGKSWAARYKALTACLHYSGFRALIVRRTYPELTANHIQPLLDDLAPVLAGAAKAADLRAGKALAAYNKDDKVLTFQNGSRLAFGFCQNDDDVARYQGQEYDFVLIDEATHFTEYQFLKLSEICRGVNDYPKRVYLTCNPGGIGHGWVKRLFIDRHYYENENPEHYAFIAANIDDNRILTQKDPLYRARLEALPMDIREADLHGNWEVYSGQFFKEFDPKIHVTEPYGLPAEWARYRSIDYGLDMLACYWHAVKPNGDVVTYRELHLPNLLASQATEKILSLTGREEQILFTVAPPDLWSRQKDRGKSIVELFFQNGLQNIIQGDNNREAGWLDLKEWLRVEDGHSSYTIFSCCKHLIQYFPQAQADQSNPNDMAHDPHHLTHALDAVRYFFRTRPHPAQLREPPKEEAFRALRKGERSGSYDGYGETL